MRRAALVTAAVVLTSCAPQGADRLDGRKADERVNPIQPISRVDELDPDTAAWLAASTNEFGFDVFSELSDGGNVVVSPISIAAVLTMMFNGATGETADAIAATLHLGDRDEEQINTAYASLLALLEENPDADLLVANSLWANRGAPLEATYVERVGEAFGAHIDEVDLGSPDTSERIDDWVRRETRHLVDGIARDLALPDPQALLVLLNAVYFKGDWTDPFAPDETSDRPFRRSDGTTVSVPMMTRDDLVLHARGDGFEMVRLPYGKRGRFAMEIVLPAGPLDQLHLDAETWAKAVEGLSEERLLLAVPRFELEYATDGGALDEALRSLGMELPYSRESDFRRMSAADPWLSTVTHKTYIRVDEKGTEAAAVTGGAMVTSAPPDFTVDRPFLFTISDTDTGAIIFLGVVTDPTA